MSVDPKDILNGAVVIMENATHPDDPTARPHNIIARITDDSLQANVGIQVGHQKFFVRFGQIQNGSELLRPARPVKKLID